MRVEIILQMQSSSLHSHGNAGLSEPGEPPGFGRSVNPILTRGDRLCPPSYYWHTRIFRPSDGPAFMIKFKLQNLTLFHTYFWFDRWLSVVGRKLKDVNRPVNPVWYCKHPGSGLEKIFIKLLSNLKKFINRRFSAIVLYP